MSDELRLDVFADALRDTLDRELASAASPDVAAVVGRARELDADAVSLAMAAAAGELAPVVTLQPTGPQLALRPFQEAYEASVHADVRERALHPLPTPRAPTRVRRWVAVAAVAAGVALVASVGSLVELARQGDDGAAEQARRTAESGAAGGVAADRSTRAGAGGVTVIREPTGPAELEPPGEEPPTVDPAPPDDAAEPTGGPPDEKLEGKAREDRLAELDAAAQKAWRAGDLARAERLLNEVVRKGGRQSRVELAHGDLFALAHRRGDRAAQLRYWKRYLRRFPNGRFAGDARAGLCRLGDGDAARCWERYLKRHPGGTHRREAEAALRGHP